MTRTAQSPAERRKRSIPRWLRAGPLIVLLVAGASLVAACGGGGSHDAASSPPNGTSAQSSARQSGVLYASCMRGHGVPDFPDSAVAVSDGQVEFDIPRGIKHESRFASASQACQRDLPGSSVPPKHTNIQEELNFARCMRSHGITDFPDPLPSGGWDLPGDTSSPQFHAAAHACQATGIHWNGG
jgi:hypothetical protein